MNSNLFSYLQKKKKNRNPKAPSRDHFLNLDPKDWKTYDIDWPEFNAINLNYLNIGMPPAIFQKYKSRLMTFWNQDLPEELNRTLNMKPIQPYPELYAPPPTIYPRFDSSVNPAAGISGKGRTSNIHVSYFPEKSTEDPIRALHTLLHQPNPNRSDMYNTQSTMLTTAPPDVGVVENIAPEEIIVRADATLNILIVIFILFLLVNVIVITAYLIKKNYYNRTMKRKLDVLTLDGTTDDDVKRSKFNDGDESFILDIVRKKNEYETPDRRNRSPINGFLLSRQLSSSTVDAHTKVCDWMSQEISKQAKQKKPSPNFSLKSRSFFRRPGKVNVAIDATPSARSASILRQEPAEFINTNQSFDFDTKDMIICQEMEIDSALIDSVDLRDSMRSKSRRNSIASAKGSADIIKIDHRHSRSDPVQMYYHRPQKADEDITVFIEDINVTSREEASEREPLSAEDALKTIKMRNYPKVLPNYPDSAKDYVSASIKRRSLPPQYFSMNPALKTPPTPPPRTTSTLGRRPSVRRESTTLTTSPIMMAEEPPVHAEPEITCNVLHVGPLIPKSTESLYSTLRKQPPSPDKPKTFSFENSITIESINEQSDSMDIEPNMRVVEPSVHMPTGIKPPSGQRDSKATRTNKINEPQIVSPKIIIKPNLIRQNSTEKKPNGHITRVQAPQDVCTTKPIGSKIPTIKKATIERDRSLSDSSASSASGETVKQIF